MSLLDMFCNVDDFCRALLPKYEAGLLTNGAIHC